MLGGGSTVNHCPFEQLCLHITLFGLVCRAKHPPLCMAHKTKDGITCSCGFAASPVCCGFVFIT